MRHSTCPAKNRSLALALAIVMASACVTPAVAAEPIGNGVTPTYDEAYYATLDYYGNIMDGSVVKSYTLNGASVLTDYGTYDDIVNLTDDTAPSTEDGATTFRFREDAAPSHFYFEGKTSAPFEQLPWNLSVSYTLNGVPTKAEDLAGKVGVVEIIVDAVPNETASEYARNNYTLESMAIFNQDDILSLEAPGAQVQLIGNLRTVLFVALPGETQHFVIRVGSEDFSFAGMTFLLVPATLSQLEEISKLSQRKDDLEDNYNKLSSSLDELLSSFSALGGSLRETANGLDELNAARDTISKGKDKLYDDGDQLLDDLTALNGSLENLPGHLKNADESIDDVKDSLSQLVSTAVKLQKNLDDLDDCLRDLQRDLRDLRHNSGDLQTNLQQLGTDLKVLQERLQEVKETLNVLDISINGGALSQAWQNQSEEIKKILKVQGQELSKVLAQVDQLEAAWVNTAKDPQGKPTETIVYQQFLVTALISGGAAPEAAKQVPALVQQVDQAIAQLMGTGVSQEAAAQQVLATLQPEQVKAYQTAKITEQVYSKVCGGLDQPMSKTQFFTAMLMLNDIKKLDALPDGPEKQAKLNQILANEKEYAKTAALLAKLNNDHDLKPVMGLLENLSILLGHMGNDGLTGKLDALLKDTDTTLGHLGDTSEVGQDILSRLNHLLDDMESLDDTIQAQIPGLHDTLEDTRSLIGHMVTTVDDTHTFLTSFRSLAKSSGKQLDAGTKKSLENLAETLRRTARSTDAVGGVKTAKDAVSQIVEDTWEEYTGDVNRLLLMDATANAQSLTSEKNPAPSSVQVLIRTQEIKTEAPEEESASASKEKSTTFWGRVTQMFQDLWNTATGIFR